MQEQIIRQASEKELKSIQERVKKCQEGKLSKTERAKLVKDCMKYVEKSRTNSYTRANSSRGEALVIYSSPPVLPLPYITPGGGFF